MTLETELVTCPPAPPAPSGPCRIQRQHTKGWRMPEGAVYVGRGSRWGNPLPGKIKGLTAEQIVTGYRDLVTRRKTILITPDYVITIRATDVDRPIPTADEIRDALAGKVLACWCPPGASCHGDELVAIANAPRDMVRVLHLSGSRRDRMEAEAIASAMVRSADRIVHHWRPWTDARLADHRTLPPIPGSRAFKVAHLAVIAALIFLIAVVIYNAAKTP